MLHGTDQPRVASIFAEGFRLPTTVDADGDFTAGTNAAMQAGYEKLMFGGAIYLLVAREGRAFRRIAAARVRRQARQATAGRRAATEIGVRRRGLGAHADQGARDDLTARAAGSRPMRPRCTARKPLPLTVTPRP